MNQLIKIAEQFALRGASCYFVGGTTRNEILGLPVDDIDICIVNLHDKQLVKQIISKFGTISEEVGNTFPNYTANIDGEKIDFALARTETKTGNLHQDFVCQMKNVGIIEDLYRRDLTINAIAKNVLTGEIVDPYNGIKDLKDHIANPVSDAFSEDPLRVVRAGRFISYFDLYPSPALLRICKNLSPNNISKERIGGELMKVMKYAKTPSMFFDFLREIGWLELLFPELYALIGVPQSVKHHPEGDTYIHTMHCIDTADGWFQRTVMLCHDLGKATTTEIADVKITPYVIDLYNRQDDKSDMKISAHGHEKAGVEPTHDMLSRIVFGNGDVRTQIATLVKLHMLRISIDKGNYVKLIRKTVRELSSVGLQYNDLIDTIYYDLCGRPPLTKPDLFEVFVELYGEYAFELENTTEVDQMKLIVNGKMLIEAGIEPGKLLGEMKKRALELQDEGVLTVDNWKKRLHECGFNI